MKLFLFERIDDLTGRYHQEGGLAIVATNKDRAREMFDAHANEVWSVNEMFRPKVKPVITEQEWESAIVYDVGNEEERMIIFPDSGCC